ncbi:MAG: DUF2341 domain-containing protein, partial [Verrucomicrobiota bacterium]
MTDPHSPDTDRDGFIDSGDSNPVSRAWIDWGDPWFTNEYQMGYTWPIWFTNAQQTNGVWTTNEPTAWAASSTSGVEGTLFLDVDRDLVTTDLVMRLTFVDHTNSSLMIDLIGSNDVDIATNLFGNILQGTLATNTLYYLIPFGSYESGTAVRIRQVSGDITIHNTLIYRDDDLDGLDNDQESQLGTDPELVDTDGDGFSDLAEVLMGTDPAIASGYRLKVTFCGYDHGESLVNFPVLLKLGNNISNFNYETFLSSAAHDLRIWNSNQTEALSYDIDTWDTGGVSLIWVKIPQLTKSNDHVWLTWGDAAWSNQPVYATNGSTWSENYVGVWHMNRTDPPDATLNGNDGTGTDVTTDFGIIGHGVVFDGYGCKVDITQEHKLPIYNNALNDEFTFTGWVKGPDQAGNRYFSEGNSADDNPYYSYLTKPGTGGTTGHGRVAIKDDNATTLESAETGQIEFDNTWRHLVWVDDAGTLDHWVDGVQDLTNFDYTRGTLTLNNTTFGALQRTTLIKEFDGMLDEFRISEGVRSSNWIYTAWRNVTEYNSMLCPGPVVAPPTPPAVDNANGVSGLTPNAVWLNGRLTAGADARVEIYWGSTDGGTNASAWANVITAGVFSGFASISEKLEDIQQYETNYYRLYASNSFGTAWADTSETFYIGLIGYRVRVEHCGYNGASILSNFPSLIQLDSTVSNFNYATFLSTNGYDLRVWNSNQTEELHYEIDIWDTGRTSLIWVKMPELASAEAEIWLTWGD